MSASIYKFNYKYILRNSNLYIICGFASPMSSYKNSMGMSTEKKDVNSSRYFTNSCLWQQHVIITFLRLRPVTAAPHISQDFYPMRSEGRRKQMRSKGAVESLLGDKKELYEVVPSKTVFHFCGL